MGSVHEPAHLVAVNNRLTIFSLAHLRLRVAVLTQVEHSTASTDDIKLSHQGRLLLICKMVECVYSYFVASLRPAMYLCFEPTVF